MEGREGKWYSCTCTCTHTQMDKNKHTHTHTHTHTHIHDTRSTHLESLVSGISLSNGILSLRYWLNPLFVNPLFSSSFSSSVSGSKFLPQRLLSSCSISNLMMLFWSTKKEPWYKSRQSSHTAVTRVMQHKILRLREQRTILE